jgi:hypothetical protein
LENNEKGYKERRSRKVEEIVNGKKQLRDIERKGSKKWKKNSKVKKNV